MYNNQNMDAVLGFTPSSMHDDLKKQEFRIADSDIPPLSVNKYPLYINEKAIPIWKKVVQENRPVLRMFDSKKNKWIAALILFRDACVLAKINPFDATAMLPPSSKDALVYMKDKADTAAQLFNDFADRVFLTLKSRGAKLVKVNKPTLTGPDACPLYASMDCYKFTVISRFKDIDTTVVANVVKSQGSFTLVDSQTSMYQGPAKNGVRSLCYITNPVRNTVAITWVGSVFAHSYTTLRGIKKRVIDRFSSQVRWYK